MIREGQSGEPPVRLMRKSRAWAVPFLALAVFLVPLFPGAATPAEARDVRAGLFSLTLCDARDVQGAPTPAATPVPEKYTFKNLARDFLQDAGQIWSYPAHIKSRDILPMAGLAVITGFLIANDEDISSSVRIYRDSHRWVRAVSPVITQMGSWGAWGTAGVFLGVGLITGDRQSTETAVLAANAMLQSTILVNFLKGLTGRQRPYVADGVDHWSGPVGFVKMFEKGNAGRYDSFPSAHTITAFSLATVVAMQYHDSVWVPILSYTVATGVGLSRLTEGKHWLSDVLVGGILGHLVGRLVVRNHRRRYRLTPVAGLDHGTPSFALSLARE